MASPYSSDGSDSYDSDEHVDATVNQAPLAASGYNYGEPGMQHNGSDDSDDDDDDDDESMSDEDNNSTSRPAEAATPPRGKTFRLPTGGNDSSSSDDDEPVVRPSPIAPRGKELRLTKKVMGADESSSSDDEALITKRSTKQKANGATPSKSSSAGVKKSNNSSASKKKAATPASSKKKNAAAKKDASKPAARIKVKAKSPSGGSKKRKEPPPPAPSDSESDSDDDDVVAAVVVEGSDSDDEVLAVAEPIKSNKRVKTKDGAPKKSKISSKKSPSGGSTPSAKKSSKKKSSKAKSSPGNASVVDALPEVPAEKADAAQEARHSLQEAVSRLPYAVSDTHTVRSFGRIKPEYGVVAFDALYSSPHAIYPVGFSCDRFEFSPVHGRIIKVRCDILDGGSLREQREELKKAKERQKEEGKGEPALVEESSQDENDLRNDDNECFGDGPVFRVMWGEGVEDVDPSERSYPFDPYAAPAYVGGDVDAVAVPLSSNGGAPGMPEVGMRVSVRFEKGKMYGGTITKTSTADKSSGKQAARKSSCNISIQYDDGVSEDATYPDPDIYLVPPGKQISIWSF